MNENRGLVVLLFLATSSVVVFPFSSMFVSPAFADEEASESQKQLALSFIEKVGGINLSAYSIELLYHYTDEVPVTDWGFVVRLTKGAEHLKIILEVEKKSIVSYFTCNGTSSSTRQGKSALEVAQHTLEALRSSLNCSITTQSFQLLSRAAPNQNQTITQANLTLQVTNNGRGFQWYYTANSVKILGKSLLILVSENGHLTRFFNTWDLFNVGSTDITVSMEQAINIALPYAKRYASIHGRTIKSVNATLSYVSDPAEFRGDKYMIYPEWHVRVVFEHSSNDPLTRGYNVLLWADTGSVYSAAPAGYFIRDDQETPLNNLLSYSIIVAAIASVSTVSFAAYKKHLFRKKPRR